MIVGRSNMPKNKIKKFDLITDNTIKDDVIDVVIDPSLDQRPNVERSMQIFDAIKQGVTVDNKAEISRVLPMGKDVLRSMERVVPLAIEKIQEIIATSKNERAVLQAIEFLFNRVYGKAIQPIDLDAKVDNNTTIEIKLSGELDQWSK